MPASVPSSSSERAPIAGLWPFSHRVLEELHVRGLQPVRVEAHDDADAEGSDLLWIEHHPGDELSEGIYYAISETPVQLFVALDDDQVTGACTYDHWVRPAGDMAAFESVVELIEASMLGVAYQTERMSRDVEP